MTEDPLLPPDSVVLGSGALILLGQVLKDHPKLRVRIAYREAGFDVEFSSLTGTTDLAGENVDFAEQILRETAPVLRHALLAALNRLVDEWLHR